MEYNYNICICTKRGERCLVRGYNSEEEARKVIVEELIPQMSNSIVIVKCVNNNITKEYYIFTNDISFISINLGDNKVDETKKKIETNQNI